jgi:hypothetical protein
MGKVTTRRSGCLMLFGLLFFLVGTGIFVFTAIPALLEFADMRQWQSTDGVLTQAALETSRGKDSTTYRATASYHYDVAGRRYRNDRVAIMGGADNIGDFQRELGSLLESRLRSNQTVTVWYDPENPADSVLNREMRWGMLGFLGVFLLAFGGVGGGVLYWGWRGHKVVDAPRAREKPWLADPDWQDGQIRSGARGGMVFLWVFAALWNVISLPLAFFLPQAVKESGAVIHVFWLFPAIGLVMLVLAVVKTRQWRRFGRTILTMDPFPGSVGGDVGGEIAVNTPWDPSLRYTVTLTCMRSEIRGTGKNRSRRETPVWQDSGPGDPTVAGEGIRIRFRFQVPHGLPVSEDKGGGDYHLWRVRVHAEMRGADLDRSFEIPVYATGEHSAELQYTNAAVPGTAVPGTVVPGMGETLDIGALLPMERRGNEVLIRYPALRNPGRNLAIMLFGAVFSAIGLLLFSLSQREGIFLLVMGGIFFVPGLLIALAGLFALLNSLEILLDGGLVSTVRRIFGYPVRTRRAAYQEIDSIRSRKVFSGTVGNRAVLDFNVEAHYPGGRIVLAQHLGSHSEVERVRSFFGELLGVPG